MICDTCQHFGTKDGFINCDQKVIKRMFESRNGMKNYALGMGCESNYYKPKCTCNAGWIEVDGSHWERCACNEGRKEDA